MHMRMMVQILTPRVQYQQHADLSAEAFGMSSHAAEGLRRRLEQSIVKHARVGQRQLGDRGRQGEDDVEILDRQQMFGLTVEPLGPGQGLAFGTMAVATGVVGDAVMTAVEAMLDMPAQGGGAAGSQVTQRLVLRAGQPTAMLGPKGFAVLPKDIRHLHRRPRGSGGCHGCTSVPAERPSDDSPAAPVVVNTGRGTTKPSSNCGNCCNRRMLMCRYFAVVLK